MAEDRDIQDDFEVFRARSYNGGSDLPSRRMSLAEDSLSNRSPGGMLHGDQLTPHNMRRRSLTAPNMRRRSLTAPTMSHTYRADHMTNEARVRMMGEFMALSVSSTPSKSVSPSDWAEPGDPEREPPAVGCSPSPVLSCQSSKRQRKSRTLRRMESSPVFLGAAQAPPRRVRSFVISKRGRLDRKGEHEGSRSSSICSNESRKDETSARSGASSLSSAVGAPDMLPMLKVMITGSTSVGKKSIINMFTSGSEHETVYSSDDDGDRCVPILLDGEESLLEFVGITNNQEDEVTEPIDAHVVVYSVTDRGSFHAALDRLVYIRKEWGRHVALILVGNKTDLVRTRIIMSEEGNSAAKRHACKYIEVSAAFDHRIDELLVGILKQIRLIRSKQEKARQKVRGCSMGQNILGRIFKGDGRPTKSYDNLYML